MEKTELTAREKNEGRVRLLRLLQLLETDSDAEHPISTPDCIRLLKERWDIDAFRITIGRDMEALKMAGYDVQTIRRPEPADHPGLHPGRAEAPRSGVLHHRSQLHRPETRHSAEGLGLRPSRRAAADPAEYAGRGLDLRGPGERRLEPERAPRRRTPVQPQPGGEQLHPVRLHEEHGGHLYLHRQPGHPGRVPNGLQGPSDHHRRHRRHGPHREADPPHL